MKTSVLTEYVLTFCPVAYPLRAGKEYVYSEEIARQYRKEYGLDLLTVTVRQTVAVVTTKPAAF